MPDDFRELDSRHQIGGNLPPLDVQLAEETQALAERRDQLVAMADRAPAVIADEEWEKRIADSIRLISACRKTAETTRVARKEPYLASERLVDAFFKKITDPLDKARRILEERLTIFQRKKAEDERRRREAEMRARAEEAERQRREAEAAAAAITTEGDLNAAITADELAKQAEADAIRAQKEALAKPADLSRQRGDYGAVASLRTYWDFAELDRDKIDLEALRSFLAVDDIEKAIRLAIRTGVRELRGVKIFENSRSAVR
jgi:hypothetical protein